MKDLDRYGPVLTPDDLADALRISRSQAYRILQAGLIRSVRVGRLVRVPKADVAAFIAGNVDGPSAGQTEGPSQVPSPPLPHDTEPNIHGTG